MVPPGRSTKPWPACGPVELGRAGDGEAQRCRQDGRGINYEPGSEPTRPPPACAFTPYGPQALMGTGLLQHSPHCPQPHPQRVSSVDTSPLSVTFLWNQRPEFLPFLATPGHSGELRKAGATAGAEPVLVPGWQGLGLTGFRVGVNCLFMARRLTMPPLKVGHSRTLG